MTRVKTSIIVGRFVFFALMVTQCFFLASYPAYYEDEDAWYAVSLLFFPAVTMWWCLISIDATLYQVYIFWMLYIWLGIVPMIGIVFGKTGNKVENQGFWNANTLKMTLCITPLLHFLIRHTGIATTDSHVHVTELSEWSAKAIMNLFDGIELIAVVLDENECSYGISRHFMNTLIAFTCISFLWWPFDMLIYESYDDSVVRVLDFVQVSFDTIFLSYDFPFLFFGWDYAWAMAKIHLFSSTKISLSYLSIRVVLSTSSLSRKTRTMVLQQINNRANPVRLRHPLQHLLFLQIPLGVVMLVYPGRL